jgi:hypothetical protein
VRGGETFQIDENVLPMERTSETPLSTTTTTLMYTKAP